MGEKNPPTRPYLHTEWKLESKAELYGLMHASVKYALPDEACHIHLVISQTCMRGGAFTYSKNPILGNVEFLRESTRGTSERCGGVAAYLSSLD